MYDFYKPQDGWTALPSMNVSRNNHGCGLATKNDGTKLLVVFGGRPGINNAEAYEWVDGGETTSTWQ